jgi:hypothetical protein
MNENRTQIGALALDLHDFSLFSAFFAPFAVYFHEEYSDGSDRDHI